MHVSDSVRAGLERRPRRAFQIDEAALTAFVITALAAFYEFPGTDLRGRHWAFRRDGCGAISGATHAEMRRKVMADFANRPVTIP